MTLGRPIRVGPGYCLVDHHLRGAQHALFLALGSRRCVSLLARLAVQMASSVVPEA